jgi:hypothetical protein
MNHVDRSSAEGHRCNMERFEVEEPWSDAVRAFPNEFLRTPLFSPRRRGPRLLIRESLSANKGVQLNVMGDSLSQLDRDVWAGVCHLSRHGNIANVEALQLSHLTGRRPGGHAQRQIRSSLDRLADFHIDLSVSYRTGDHFGYKGRLVDRVDWNVDKFFKSSTKRVQVSLNPQLS